MKKIVFILITLFMTMNEIAPSVRATDLEHGVFLMVGNQNVLIDGKLQKVSKENESIFPFIMDDRVLVPLRALSNLFDAEIGWDDQCKTATVRKGKNKAEITVGQKEIIINHKSIPMDTEGIIIYGSFFLPLRIVAENILGQQVSYIADQQNNARIIFLSDQKPDETSLRTRASQAAQQLMKAVENKENGLSKDEKYYYINGRAYMVSGFAQKKGDFLCEQTDCPLHHQQVRIPLLSINWRLLSDPKIYQMVYQDFSTLMQEVTFGSRKKSVMVRKEIADEVKAILDKVEKNGYLIHSIGGFRISQQDYLSESQAKGNGKEAGMMWARFHPNGLAIDINWEQNPILYKGSAEFEKEEKERGILQDALHIKFHYNNHFVVDTFLQHGWIWGGLWNTTKDYMHFSLGEY